MHRSGALVLFAATGAATRSPDFEVVFLSLQDRFCPNVEKAETSQTHADL